MLTRSSASCLIFFAFAILLDVFVTARSFRQPPLSAVSLIENARIISWQTDPQTVHCTSTFTLVFAAAFPHEGRTEFRLSLEPNHDLLRDATVEYIDHAGETVRTESIIRHEHKIFKGEAYVRDQETRQWFHCGWARITVLRDGSEPLFEGVYIVNGDVHHVKVVAKYNMQKDEDDANVNVGDEHGRMAVYRDSDRYVLQRELVQRSVDEAVSSDQTNVSICATDRLEFNLQPGVTRRAIGSLNRRQSDTGGSTGGSRSQLASTIGNTNGCPNIRQVALVAAAVDCSYVTGNGNATATRSNLISVYNSASAVYESQLNISLGLSNIVMTDAACPASPPASALWNAACNSSFSMDNDLSVFSAWRGQRGNDGVALWTLFTGCSAGVEVGVAWLGQLCQYTAQTQGGQTVSGANVVGTTQSEWQVLAHELGHGFGAYHDCTSDLCSTDQTCCPLSTTTCNANQQFIMNPTTMDSTNRFSQCTIGNICSGFSSKIVSTSCLNSNRNVTLITAGECGNGIVEDGEECDCGGASGCANDPCCDPTTCKFTAGSVCDDSNDACCVHCQFAPSTKVCRPSTDAKCDPQETCTGNSSACPKDITTPDGTKCGNGLACAAGTCTSRDLQCQQALNGSSGSCDDSSCLLSCNSALAGPGTCYLLQTPFVDGTPCGFGLSGQCKNGNCENQSTTAAIGNWIQQNKTIVIIIAAVIGTLLLLCLGSCLYRVILRRKKGAAFIPTNRQTPYRAPRTNPQRQASMAYYPQTAPAYSSAPRDINYSYANTQGQAPLDIPAYGPPMRQDRGGSREQLPGEEWAQGPDGTFYPPGQGPQGRNVAAPRPTQPRSRRQYWQ